MMNREQKILVVDDEPTIVEVVAAYLEKNSYTVLTASTGLEALDLFAKNSPSLLVLDWMLPDITGQEVLRRVRIQSAVPVILLTARVEENSILEGFQTGADDYVTKPFSPRQLVARIEAVLRRTGKGASAILSFFGGELEIDPEALTVKKCGLPVILTPNEFKLLGAFAQHPKKVYNREELLTVMSGGAFEGSDRVVDTHIKNIRQKLETDPKNPQYILTVHGVGYRFGGE